METQWKDSHSRQVFSIIIILLFIIIYSLSSLKQVPSNPKGLIIGTLAISLVVFLVNSFYSKPKKKGNLQFLWYTMVYLILPISIVLILPIPNLNKILYYLGSSVLLIFLISSLYFLSRYKLNYVTNEGIRIGNAYLDNEKDVFLKQKATFLNWDEIKSIKIKGKASMGAFASTINDFLFVQTKKGNQLNCFLADNKGFVESLKKIKRFGLLSKDSKYK